MNVTAARIAGSIIENEVRRNEDSGFLSHFAGWRPIETAPRDERLIVAYVPASAGAPAIVGVCAWDPAIGFQIDGRVPSHWIPYQPA